MAGFFANSNARCEWVFTATLRALSDIFGSADHMQNVGSESMNRLPGWLDCSSALLASAVVRSGHASTLFCCVATKREADVERTSSRAVTTEAMRFVVMVVPRSKSGAPRPQACGTWLPRSSERGL
jgi:hypothetical protein